MNIQGLTFIKKSKKAGRSTSPDKERDLFYVALSERNTQYGV